MTLEQQQLAEALEQNLVLSKQTDHTILDLSNYVDSLEQQLAAALAACKLKDDAVQHLIDEAKLTSSQYEVCRQSLAIQPDDAALKAWLGEPVAWLEGNPEGLWFVAYSKNDKAPQKPLYSPKGLK